MIDEELRLTCEYCGEVVKFESDLWYVEKDEVEYQVCENCYEMYFEEEEK
jgi:hypothetical protein